jgi:outer membrane biosynthesis protein TonB
VTVSAHISAADSPPGQQPAEVPPSEARYLRTYESFPSLPRSLWVSGRSYAVLAQVCVAIDGGVSGVSIRNGAAPELDRAITATVRSWRYRPRVVEGAARPFCHLMRFVYTTL